MTNGQEWIFLLLHSDTNTGRARYLESKHITLMEPGPEGNSVISLQQCNLLAAIISYWASGLGIDGTIYQW